MTQARRMGPALETMYQFLLWLVPAVEKFPRRQKFLLGDRIPHLAGKRPIRHISTRQRQPRWRHHQRGEPLIDSSQTVQNRRATSRITPYQPGTNPFS